MTEGTRLEDRETGCHGSVQTEPSSTEPTRHRITDLILQAAARDDGEWLREQTAGNGSEWPETLLYYRARDLYRDYRKGRVERSDAEAAKRKVMQQYDRDVAERTLLTELYVQNAARWKAVEQAVREYTHRPSVDTADRIVTALYGMGRKEQR